MGELDLNFSVVSLFQANFHCRKKYIYGNQEQWSVGDSTATFNCRLNHKIYTTQIVQYHSQVLFYWCSNTTALLKFLLNNDNKKHTKKKERWKQMCVRCILETPHRPGYTLGGFGRSAPPIPVKSSKAFWIPPWRARHHKARPNLDFLLRVMLVDDGRVGTSWRIYIYIYIDTLIFWCGGLLKSWKNHILPHSKKWMKQRYFEKGRWTEFDVIFYVLWICCGGYSKTNVDDSLETLQMMLSCSKKISKE